MLEGNADIVEASQSNEVGQAVADMQSVVEGGKQTQGKAYDVALNLIITYCYLEKINLNF